MKKKRSYAQFLFLIASILLNIVLAPLALLIGVFATDAPGSGMKEFLMGFFFIQGLPFILLILSIVLLIRKLKRA